MSVPREFAPDWIYDCQSLAVSINYPPNKNNIEPLALSLDPEGQDKLTKPFVIERNDRVTARWKVGDLRFGQHFKFRW